MLIIIQRKENVISNVITPIHIFFYALYLDNCWFIFILNILIWYKRELISFKRICKISIWAWIWYETNLPHSVNIISFFFFYLMSIHLIISIRLYFCKKPPTGLNLSSNNNNNIKDNDWGIRQTEMCFDTIFSCIYMYVRWYVN